MRKYYFLLLAMLMSALAMQAQDFTVDGLQYQINTNKEGEVYLWGFTCTSGVVNAPSQVTNPNDNKTYTVTGVAGVIPSENWWEDGTPNGFKNRTDLRSVSLPETVRVIGKNAFEGSGLLSIHMPADMDSIGDEAFVWCSNMAKVEMPKTLKYLGNSAFNNCLALTAIDIPAGLTWTAYKPEGVFSRCGYLQTVNLPADMTAVPKNFFYGCQNLESVTLPEGVTSIGYQAFNGCLQLKDINFPKKLREIGNMAFQDCSQLTSFVASDSLRSINYWAFKNCYALSSISISAAVNSIDNQAFAGCNAVKSFTVYGENATYAAKNNMLLSKDQKTLFFRMNKSEKIFTLPDGVETIGRSALAGENIKAVVLPASVKEIQENAFYGDSILAMHFMSTTPPAIGNDMFDKAMAGAKAFVPRNTAKAYQDVSNLSRFNIVEEDALPFIYTDVQPRNENYLQALDVITVDFEEPATLKNASPEVSILEDNAAMQYSGSWTAELANDGKRLVLTYKNSNGVADKLPLSVKKEYIINIPAGVVGNAQGLENDIIDVDVYGPDKLTVVSTSPAEGEHLSSLKGVEVTFDSEVLWLSQYGNHDFKLYKNGAECELPADKILYSTKRGPNVIKYNIYNKRYDDDCIALDEGAQYKIVIPANLVYKASNKGALNDEIVINFVGSLSDGIKGLDADKTTSSDKIYTVSGVLMKGSKDSLPAGVYVINGKKVMVTKK